MLIGNPRRLASLTEQERSWLQEAARSAAAASVSVAASREQSDVRADCSHGARYAAASKVELAALRRTFAPVYRMLERDPETRTYIRRIEALKRATEARHAPTSRDRLHCPA